MLLVGETGTGKELLARGIHSAGESASQPFVAVNCAAIPVALLESELFGHEAGAFTDARVQKRGLFELAGAGTLFLDEVGELPNMLQPKLLRVLEERSFRRLGGLTEHKVNCRVVAGTNVTLEEAVADGTFRDDLFYRLNVFQISIPPLRERIEDVELLANHFLGEISREQGGSRKRLHPAATAALRGHLWPGNVRELRNIMERAAIVCADQVIGPTHLMLQPHSSSTTTAGGASATLAAIRIPPEGKSLEEIEREAVELTLLLTHGNLSAAARILGISRPTLARKMRINGMTRRSVLASS